MSAPGTRALSNCTEGWASESASSCITLSFVLMETSPAVAPPGSLHSSSPKCTFHVWLQQIPNDQEIDGETNPTHHDYEQIEMKQRPE